MNHSKYIHIFIDIKMFDSYISILKFMVLKLISITEISEDNRFKITFLSEHKKERSTVYDLEYLVYELHIYFSTKIFTKKTHQLNISLYHITHEEGLIYRIHQDNIELTWGGVDITYYTVYYIINKNSKFKNLQCEKIISTLSSFINKNYSIIRNKKKNLSKREDYIQTIYN